MTTELAKVLPGARITGAPRETLRRQVVAQYKAGRSIREIAGFTGRSYGAIHRLLTEAGTTFRPRGGNQRNR